MAKEVDIRHSDQHEAFIAAALILSNYALLNSNLSLAWVHLKAVRTLIRTVTLIPRPNERLFVFLTNQAAAFDVLACTASFDMDKIEGAILPECQSNDVVFGRFLLTLHDITMQTRSGEPTTGTIGEIENRLELARASTLVAAASLPQSSEVVFGSLIKDDFVRVVQLYHHAGVLYGHLRLKKFHDHASVEYHSSRLFQTLESFEDLRATAHNLAWPLFIAGISCWPNAERLKTTQRLLTLVTETTRFRHYSNILLFHQELWNSQHHDWTILATDWENAGSPIIPV